MQIPVFTRRLACALCIAIMLQGCRADKETITIVRHSDSFTITVRDHREADRNLPYAGRIREFTAPGNLKKLRDGIHVIDSELYVINNIKADAVELKAVLDEHLGVGSKGAAIKLGMNHQLILDFGEVAKLVNNHYDQGHGFLWFGGGVNASDIRKYVEKAISEKWAPAAEPIKNIFGMTTGYAWEVREGAELTFLSPSYIYLKINNDPDGHMDRICFKQFLDRPKYYDCTSLYPDYLQYLQEMRL